MSPTRRKTARRDLGNQHRHNAIKEKRWIGDAKRDAANLTRSSKQLKGRGLTVESKFDAEEARNARSWVKKRQKILKRETDLSHERQAYVTGD